MQWPTQPSACPADSQMVAKFETVSRSEINIQRATTYYQDEDCASTIIQSLPHSENSYCEETADAESSW